MPATRSRRRATAAADMSLLNDSPMRPSAYPGGGEGETSMTMLMDQSLHLTPRPSKGRKPKGKASATINDDPPQQLDELDDAELSRLAWGEAAQTHAPGSASPPEAAATKSHAQVQHHGTPDRQGNLPLIALSPNIEVRRKRSPRKTITPKATEGWPQEDVGHRGPPSQPLPEPVKKEAPSPLLGAPASQQAPSKLPTRAKARATSIAAIVAGSRAAAAEAETQQPREGRQERRRRLGLDAPAKATDAHPPPSSPPLPSSSPKRRLTSLLSFSPSKGKNLVPPTAAGGGRHASSSASSSSLLMSSSSPLRSQQRRVQPGARGIGSGSELLRLMGKTPSPKKQRRREEVDMQSSSPPVARPMLASRAPSRQLLANEIVDEEQQRDEEQGDVEETQGGGCEWDQQEGEEAMEETSTQDQAAEDAAGHDAELDSIKEDAEVLEATDAGQEEGMASPPSMLKDKEDLHEQEQDQDQDDAASSLHDDPASPDFQGHEASEQMSLDDASVDDGAAIAPLAAPVPTLAQESPVNPQTRPRRSSRRSSIPAEAAPQVERRHEEAPGAAAAAAITPAGTTAKNSNQPLIARKTRSSLSSSAAKSSRQAAAERDAKLAQARQRVAAAAVARNATTSHKAVIGSTSPAKRTKVTRNAVAAQGTTDKVAGPSTARVKPAAAAPSRKPSVPVKQPAPTAGRQATSRTAFTSQQQQQPKRINKDVPAGFRLTSTGQLAPITTTSAPPPAATEPRRRAAPLASSLSSYTPSAAHLSSLLAATEASAAAAAASRTAASTTTDVPAYLARRREEVQRDADEELARRIEKARREELARSTAGGKAGKDVGRFDHLSPALMGPRAPTASKSTSSSSSTSSSAPAVPSALTQRLASRRAWETSRKARDALVEAERLAAREERERLEAEEVKRERMRRCPKANPVPVEIYGGEEERRRGNRRRGRGVKDEVME